MAPNFQVFAIEKNNTGSTTVSKQHGMSFIGFLIVAAVVVFFAIVGMKVVPTVIEYSAIQRAVKKAAQDGGETPATIRAKFDQYSAVDDISSIRGTDLDITKQNGDVVIAFKYEKKIPLFGPASIVIDYEGSSRSK
jgi:Domain of unknown function (DUF4845)